MYKDFLVTPHIVISLADSKSSNYSIVLPVRETSVDELTDDCFIFGTLTYGILNNNI